MLWEKKGILISTDDLKADWIYSHVQLPVPYKKDNDTLRLYFSARDIKCQGMPLYVDVDTHDFHIKGKTNKPLLKLGKWGSFDEHGINFCSCINKDGNLYMYYIGWNKAYKLPYKNSIGLAISEDNGETFRKYSEGPLIDRCMEYPYFVASPFVMKEENYLRMYLLSCTRWSWNEQDGYVPHYLIKSAISKDGIKWEAEEGERIVYKNDHEAIARPWVIYDGTQYIMWYSYRDTVDFRKNKENAYAIGMAVSNDGIRWIRKDEEVGISKSETGWDSEMMCYSAVIELDDRLVMFYNGNEHGKYALGYAECRKL